MITVFCTTQFEGFHRWKDAPNEVAFLRDFHRHIFHVRLEVRVTETNRQVEFIALKRQVTDYLSFRYSECNTEASCEQIALDLLRKFDAYSVEVSEDGENGAVVRRDK